MQHACDEIDEEAAAGIADAEETDVTTVDVGKIKYTIRSLSDMAIGSKYMVSSFTQSCYCRFFITTSVSEPIVLQTILLTIIIIIIIQR